MKILKRMLKSKRVGWGRKLLALIGLARIASRESLAVLGAYRRQAVPGLKGYTKLICDETRIAVNKKYGCGGN